MIKENVLNSDLVNISFVVVFAKSCKFVWASFWLDIILLLNSINANNYLIVCLDISDISEYEFLCNDPKFVLNCFIMLIYVLMYF